MSFVAEEIASQPECWSRAIALAAEHPAGLPEPGERVAVIGCGTSWFMAQAYAVLRESSGYGETDAFAASEAPLHRGYDRVLAISRSGTTTEVLEALRGAPEGTATAAITADPSTPIMTAAADTVVLDFADERSVVQTRFATSSLVLLRAVLGEDLAILPAAGKDALAEPLPDGALGKRQFTFLGSGWTIGIANEAALKLREASCSWTEAYSGMEYRHGPVSIADQHSVVWTFGTPPDGLLDTVRATGALVVHPTDRDALAELIRAQRLGVALAQARGLDPDRPRNLSRSVILAAGAS